MGTILNYKNKKTNSFINFIADGIQDIDTFCYLSKMMNYQDKKVMKSNQTKLAIVLNNLVEKVKEN